MQPEGNTDAHSAPEPAQATPWQFKTEGTPASAQPADPAPAQAPGGVSWSASEYVAHHKTPMWFLSLGFIIAIIVGGVYIVTHDVLSAVAIIVIGVVFAIFAGRQPKVLDYQVNEQGVQIGTKFYPYGVFKTFSVATEGPLHSIILMPLRRFMPSLTIYFDPNDEDKIIKVLADYLPFEEARRDAVDRLMKRIRF